LLLCSESNFGYFETGNVIPDKIIIFTTDEAHVSNWENNKWNNKGDKNDVQEIEDELQKRPD